MKRWLLAFMLLTTPALSAGWFPLAVPYIGPGNISSGALVWYGLRAYSSTYAATNGPAIDIIRASDSKTNTINILTSGGLDLGAATTFCASTTCVVSKLYDQSGANACSSAPCNLAQATAAKRPTLTFNCIGTLPCLTFVRASNQALVLAAGAPTQAQPLAYSAVAQRTGTTGSTQTIFTSNNTNTPVLNFASIAGNINASAGTSVLATSITEATWHAFNILYSGTSSNIYADGVPKIVNLGTNGMATGLGFGGLAGATQTTDGLILEAGAWPSDTSANFSALNTNQHTYWGF